MPFEFKKTEIEGLMLIKPHMYPDERGLYKKYYEKNIFAENGITCEFTESSDLYSKKGALRGLHYQTVDSQAKLIHVMCGIAINCIYLFFKLKAWKYYKPKLVDLSLIKEVCGYSLPLVPNQISGWILSASDRTIIAKFLSVAENGVYSVANKFSNLVGTFYGFFNLAWVETVSVHYNDSDRDEFIGDMMETVSNLFVSICVGIIAIMPFVFPVMVNQQYGNAYYQIPILLIAVIFQILVGLYSAIYIALKKSSTIARTTIAGAIINVLVNLALIRFIGLYAASISTLVSYASTALYRRIDIRKYIKIKVNVKNILLNSVAVVFMLRFRESSVHILRH